MANLSFYKLFARHNILKGRKSLDCLSFRPPYLNKRCSSTAAGVVNADEHLWVRSALPPVEAVRDKTISESMLERALEWGDATAYECGVTGRKYSYNQMYRYAKGFAAGLIKTGITNNQIVAFVLPNIPEFPVALFGTWEAGCIVSTVNPAYTTEEMMRQLESSGVSTVITIENLVDTVVTATKSCPALKNIIVVGKAPEGCLSFYEMMRTDPTGFDFFKGSDIDMLNSVALIPYSSGTTGPPKGVMLTHSNIPTQLTQLFQPDMYATKSLDESDGKQERMIGLLPFFHMYGLLCTIMCVRQGAHMLTLPRFDPNMFINAIKQHRPTNLQLVTPLANLMIQSPNITMAEFEEVHSILMGATPVGRALLNRLLEKAGKYIFIQEAWGMTETTAVSTLVRVSMKHSKIGSCGTALSSTILKVVDPTTGETLGQDKRGEICVQGPQVMKGYFKNEKATSETIHADGWLHTGDIGYYDESKHFYIVDRLKELIKVKGFQVSPSELEQILRGREDIADVAVIGVPSDEYGELPRAYIVLKPGKRSDEADVHTYMAKKLSKHKQLRGGIEFVDSIPKGPSGKILRRELVLSYKQKHGLEP